MRHFRQINECGTLEELKPIVENRKYDFNYQQVINLPNEVKILPVSQYCIDDITSDDQVTYLDIEMIIAKVSKTLSLYKDTQTVVNTATVLHEKRVDLEILSHNL